MTDEEMNRRATALANRLGRELSGEPDEVAMNASVLLLAGAARLTGAAEDDVVESFRSCFRRVEFEWVNPELAS